MRLLVWLLRGLLFFTLFAFALNNLHDVTVGWFFGVQWRAPMVVVVLAAFAAGCALGVAAMLPRRWSRRRPAAPAGDEPAPSRQPPRAAAGEVPREGL